MSTFSTKIICSLALLLVTLHGSGQSSQPSFQSGETILAVLQNDSQILLATNQKLYVQTKRDWQLVTTMPAPIQTTAVAQGRIWAGGQSGLYWWEARQKQWRKWQGAAAKGAINTLNTDPSTGNLLVATATAGAFVLRDTILSRTLVSQAETQTVCTCGSYQWIGTPTGLLRVDATGTIQRYAEEGVMGFEIPDNIVENLFCSRSQSLTVLMPEPLAFLPIEASGAPAHGAHFDYLGAAGNTVFNQVELSNGDYLFFTAQGILRLPTTFLHDHREVLGSVEVHDDRNNPQAAFVLSTRFTSDPMLQKEVWKKGFWDKKGNLWLTSDQQVIRVKKRDLG